MDFAMLPPEINSALMYAGPGSGPMLAAAAAWESLAGELQATAAAWTGMLTGLTDGPWQGPSAAAMAASVTPHIAWFGNTAGLAAQSGAQAAAAASAYEAAFAGTVPPVEIAANRALLATLLATNFFGINTAAIAATEAQYAEMWAQDAATMYSYAGAAATAATLNPFDPAGTLNSIYSEAITTLNGLNASLNSSGFYDVPRALLRLGGLTNDAPGLSNPLNALGITGHTWNANGDGIIINGLMGDFVEGLTGSQTLDASSFADGYIRLVNPARLTITQMKDYFGLAHDLPSWANAGAKEAAAAAKEAAKDLAAIPQALGGGGPLSGIAGSLGSAARAGALSVPASWVGPAAPAASPVTVALNGMGAAAAAEPATSAFGGMPLMPGTGAGRSVANFAAPRYGFKPLVVAAPPSGG